MNNIESYYYIIIGIGLFVMFALVGYLVELSKKNKEIEKNIPIIDDKKENAKEELLIDKDIMNK